MGSVDRMKNIGGYVGALIGIASIATDTAVNGTEIDRHTYDMQSCVLVVGTGSATGSPSAQSVAGKLQHTATTGTGYADVTNGAITAITADDTVATKDIDCSALNRFIRVVVTATLTGGSTPKIPVWACLVYGGSRVEPISAS